MNDKTEIVLFLRIRFKMLIGGMITNEYFGFEIALGSEQETVYGLRYCKIMY
jgi:hypothetical protein